jgi:CheY-like chemotaxis protein
MVKPNILVVDSDEGFGMMLAEGLQNSGRYTATLVKSGGDALQSVVETRYDLVIVDVAIHDIKPPTLIKAVREAKSDLKIMMTPLIGQDLPVGYMKLNIDGVLPKPFFVGDLPDLVDKAMGITSHRAPTPGPVPVQSGLSGHNESAKAAPAVRREDEAAATSLPPTQAEPVFPAALVAPPFVPQETIRFLRASETEILKLLNVLNREVRAEAILLIAGHDLVANSGMLSKEECAELAILVAQSSQSASQAATFLGERAGRFTQSLHEGGAYRLYTLTLSEGVLLSLALSTNVPLGMIRHQSRQIAEQLSKFII